MAIGNPGKELYKRLRSIPWAKLWAEEVPRFDHAPARERFETVAVVRAVGVVFSESGPPEQREAVKRWLVQLLHDPEEKVRRYAMAALPKVGVGPVEEAELLALLASGPAPREEKFLGRTLDKIGGEATLATLDAGAALPARTLQRVMANVVREESPSAILLDRELSGFRKLRIHLRCRRGLECILREEVEAQGKFRILEVKPGLVAVTSSMSFALGDIYSLRCFATLGLVLGLVKPDVQAANVREDRALDDLAAAITSPTAVRLFETLTEGSIRYRLEFVGKGHQRGTVQRVADRAYALCPRILNDAREAPWAIDIHHTRWGNSVELRPRISPDPRHAYRLDDVPAASHPPLAASLARIAGIEENETIWDPFCGSGVELIERTLLGGVRKVYGSDRDEVAARIAERNFVNAINKKTEGRFAVCDFREWAKIQGFPSEGITLLITNPPLGRRVRVPHLRGLFEDLFAVAANVLRPGGRFVFTNPFRMESPQPSLVLESRLIADLGGFDCRVELYRKMA